MNGEDREAGYRTGRRVGNTLYLDGVFIGSCVSPEVAALLVEAANRGRQGGNDSIQLERPPITAANLKLGDQVVDIDGEPQSVSSVRSTPGGDVEVGFENGSTKHYRAGDKVSLRAVESRA